MIVLKAAAVLKLISYWIKRYQNPLVSVKNVCERRQRQYKWNSESRWKP
jgi:hypothetical protein